MFNPQPKAKLSEFPRGETWALSDTKTSGTEKLPNMLPLRALMVILLVASLTGTNQMNLEKASTQMSMAVLPDLLLGGLSA